MQAKCTVALKEELFMYVTYKLERVVFALQVFKKLAGHHSEVTSISSDPIAPNLLVSASSDTTVKLWDMRDSKVINTFKGHTDTALICRLSPDGGWVSSGGADRNIFVGS